MTSKLSKTSRPATAYYTIQHNRCLKCSNFRLLLPFLLHEIYGGMKMKRYAGNINTKDNKN